MPNDIELLKQEFLAYLTVLVFPSPKILIDKIPSTFQETKLNKIEIKSDKGKVFFGHENINKFEYLASDLGKFGFSLENFSEYIESIKKEKSSKTFLEVIEEILDSHTKRLCETYISLAILAYTKLYEKFKYANANSKEKTIEEIYDLIYEYCLKDIISVELCYNYLSFIMAYQHSHLDTILLLDTIPFNEDAAKDAKDAKDTCLNILNTVKNIQQTPYRKIYISLIDSIEELTSLQIKDKTASNILISELKNLTNSCFSQLIQATFYEQTEKFAREKEITKKFRDDCNQLIETYKNEHPDEFKKQLSIFDRILWLVGRLISPILSKEKKMTLFGNKAINNTKKITEINSQLDQLATLNYFSRIYKC